MSTPDYKAEYAANTAAKQREAGERALEELGSDPTPAQLSNFFQIASDEQKQELYNDRGVNITSFSDEVLDRIENYIVGGKKVKDYDNYNRDEIETLIVSKTPELEKLVQDWIFQNAQNVIDGKPASRFDDFLSTQAGQNSYIDLVVEIIDSRNWFERFMGVDPRGSGKNLAESLIQAAQRNSAVPEDPEGDQKKIDDISDGQAKQCVLLNLLDPLSELCDSEMFKRTNPSGGNATGYPYSGRIVKMNCDNPSTFINYLSSVSGSNKNLAEKKAKDNLTNKKTTLDYRLSFIRSYNDELVELPVFFAGGFNYSKGKDGVLMKPSSDLPNKVIQKTTKFDVDVKYEGTNPSTYRSDVDVTITIASNTMTTFLQKWKYDGYVDDDDNQIPFTLFDLILFPYLEKDSKGYGKAYKSQYSPSYNRLRLTYVNKMSAQRGRDPKMVSFFEKNVNVLDLAIVDHEFKRDEEGKNHELVITYRGYVQSVLTSPETDILSTPDIKEKRKQRDILLKAAIEKNCSLREIQAIQQQLNRLAQADVKDISSGIMDIIYSRGVYTNDIMGLGIYSLTVTNTLQSELVTNGENVKLDKIKQLIVNGMGNTVVENSTAASHSSALTQTEKDVFTTDIENGTNKIYFFYLADLLDAAIFNSSIFKDLDRLDDPINKDVIAQKIRFIFGTFRGPPTTGNPNGKFYNIGNIPISVEYFLEWYKQNVTEKKLFIYPCLSFIRDISEKVITNMLNEICYEALEETKAVVRTSFFTGAKTNDFEPLYETAAIHYNSRTNGKQIDLNTLTDDNFPLIRPSFKENVKDYVNYCVIYTRESRSMALNVSRNVEIINYKYDYPDKHFGAETIAFSRTSQPGLRESRYERNSNSGITMLAGVYNASIKLTHPLNFIYPGQFFQISLFEPPGFDIRLPNGSKIGIFTELGLNGYYSVTKTTHKLNMKNKTNQVTVDGIWVGSKSPYDNRLPAETSKINQAVTKACEEYVDLSEEIGVLEINPSFDLYGEISNINRAAGIPTESTTPAAPAAPAEESSSDTAAPAPTPAPGPPAPGSTLLIGSSNSSPRGYDYDAE